MFVNILPVVFSKTKDGWNSTKGNFVRTQVKKVRTLHCIIFFTKNKTKNKKQNKTKNLPITVNMTIKHINLCYLLKIAILHSETVNISVLVFSEYENITFIKHTEKIKTKINFHIKSKLQTWPPLALLFIAQQDENYQIDLKIDTVDHNCRWRLSKWRLLNCT